MLKYSTYIHVVEPRVLTQQYTTVLGVLVVTINNRFLGE